MITFDEYMAGLPEEDRKEIEDGTKKLLLEIELQGGVVKQNDNIS